MGETVTVSATAAVVLQKQDAAVGQTFDNLRISLLPNARRDASQLTTLQAASRRSARWLAPVATNRRSWWMGLMCRKSVRLPVRAG